MLFRSGLTSTDISISTMCQQSEIAQATNPFAVAVKALRARSCLLDGEAVVCDANGLAVFERLRYRRNERSVFLFAFDLLETRRSGPTARAV
jgi:ATP-dependent DNA ligase